MSQNKITRESLANQISKEFGIAYTTAYKKIDTLLIISGNKILDTNLCISSLGTFKINQKSSRIGRNPKTMKVFEIKSRKVVSFKKSKKLEL